MSDKDIAMYAPNPKKIRRAIIKMAGKCIYNLTDPYYQEGVRKAELDDIFLAMTNMRRGLDRLTIDSFGLRWNTKLPKKDD